MGRVKLLRFLNVQWPLCVLWLVFLVSVGVGDRVCVLYVTASYCTVALNQVDLARCRRLVDGGRLGFEYVLCFCRWSLAGPGCIVEDLLK